MDDRHRMMTGHNECERLAGDGTCRTGQVAAKTGGRDPAEFCSVTCGEQRRRGDGSSIARTLVGAGLRLVRLPAGGFAGDTPFLPTVAIHNKGT